MIARYLPCACALAMLVSTPSLAQAGGMQALFDRFDADGDGVVTTDEVQTWRASYFDFADADQDGYLSAGEVAAMRAAAEDRMGARTGDEAAPRPRRGAGMDRDPIERYDADGDGRLSRAEFVEAPFEALERFDANNDGALTLDELPRRMRRRGG